MAFSELTSLDAEVTIAVGKTNKETGKPYPKQTEGYYLGNRVVEGRKGESILHFLRSAVAYKDLGLTVGQNLGVWGTTDLNRKLSQVTPGTMIRITSTGQKATKNGDMYTYKVEADASNTIEVSAETEVPESQGSYQDTDDIDTADEDNDQSTVLAAQKTRQAEVEAMLKNRRTAKN